MSHERLAPLRPSCSRRTSRSRLCGMTSTATARPLTVQARLDDDGVGIPRVNLLSLSARGGDLERPLHARAGQRALVLGGAVAVTHRLHLAGGRGSQLLGSREEDGGRLAGAFALDLEEPLRPRADAADGDATGGRPAFPRVGQGRARPDGELGTGRPRTLATWRATPATSGQRSWTRTERSTPRWRTVAPMVSVPFSAVIASSSRTVFTSIRRRGRINPSFMRRRSSVPPA